MQCLHSTSNASMNEYSFIKRVTAAQLNWVVGKLENTFSNLKNTRNTYHTVISLVNTVINLSQHYRLHLSRPASVDYNKP